MKTILTNVLALTILCALLLFSGGCGGGDRPAENTGTGRATYSVRWPTPSRLIPQAATSIRIQILNDTKVIKTVVLAKPATKVTLEDLPAKKLVNLVQAFPNADATGVAQAEVRSEVTIKADESIDVALTMNSTITKLEPSIEGTIALALDATQPLTATPRNAANEAVLVAPSSLRWTSSAPDTATVDASGVVRGISAGVATITATEPESGKTVTFDFTLGPTGRLIYSQIAGNIRGSEFPQNGPGTYSEFLDDDIPPLYSHDFFGKIPPPAAEVNTRECSIYLSQDAAVGTRVAVLGGAIGNPVAEVTLAEIENEYNTQDLIRKRERAFQGISGHVTLVRVQGTTRTVRLENVTMRAYDRPYGGGDGVPVLVEGQGTFVVNGTVTFRESR
jgi:hypothetical protein